MPKAAGGPKLVLFGPDEKHGATRKTDFVDYVWYIRWYDGGVKCEKTTRAGLHSKSDAEQALRTFLGERADASAPAGGYHPHQVTVGAVLQKYGKEEASAASDSARIGFGLKALWPFWSDKMLSEVGEPSCRDYVKWRMKQPTRNYKVSLAAWERRRAKAKEQGKPFSTPKPAVAYVAQETARSELIYVQAAISYCREQVFITQAPPVVLPERQESLEVWLTRTEFAKLLLAARERVPGKPNIRRHLIVYLKVGLYQPARKQAILGLPLVQPIGGGAWLDAKRGIIDFGPGTGNKKRPRQVPIHPRILVYVRGAARRGQQRLVEMVAKSDKDGKPIKRQSRTIGNVRKSFANAVKRAGIERRVTPHTLRHTGVTWLKHAGLESWTVGAYAGMSTETVDRIYAHSHPDSMKAVTEALTKRRRK